jgi:hypothetical protein
LHWDSPLGTYPPWRARTRPREPSEQVQQPDPGALSPLSAGCVSPGISHSSNLGIHRSECRIY